MSQEQLDAVKEQLMAEENDDLIQSVFMTYLEEPERGANMTLAGLVSFDNDVGRDHIGFFHHLVTTIALGVKLL